MLGTPSVSFTVEEGHTLEADFDYSALASLGVLSDYAVVVQKWDAELGQWVGIDGSGEATLLEIGLLSGNTYQASQLLEAGEYRAFVTFDGVGLGVLGELGVSGTDLDYTEIGGYEVDPATGNVITDVNGDGNSDVVTPTTVVSEVNGEAIVAGGTTIVGTYGTLVIDQDGSYTYTPNEDAAVIGQVDQFEYTLLDPVTGNTATATLYAQIGSDSVALTFDPADPGQPAVLDFSTTADDASASVVWANVSDEEYFNDNASLLGILGTTVTDTSDPFVIDENTDVSGSVAVSALAVGNANVTLALQIEGPAGTWTNVATDIHTGAILAIGEIASLDLSTLDLAPGNYRVQVTMQTPLIGGVITTIGIDTDVDVTYLDQFEIESSTGDNGNLLDNDETGSEFTTVQIFDSGLGTFVEIPSGSPVTVQGAYGTLTVDAAGNYTYTPDPALAYFDTPQLDSFTYQLVHPTGAVVAGNLDVTVNPSGAGIAAAPLVMFTDDVVGIDDLEVQPDEDPLDGGAQSNDEELALALDEGDDQNIPLGGIDSLDDEEGGLDETAVLSETETSETVEPVDPFGHLVTDDDWTENSSAI
ncbi:BapA/Bap/LapF family large adhesin [Nitratireductor soli]|uniref:BapA/Bap/LapF family large adhesin n=1 Tax=Nitratireductor soli TaxID=1670619 RepID=UPI000ACC7D44|nr:BapA/Bap/LapF family large adhesin [Nitratireductor soli]